MRTISYTKINGRFTVIGGYMHGVINNRSVIIVDSNGNKNKSNINNNNPDIQVENG